MKLSENYVVTNIADEAFLIPTGTAVVDVNNMLDLNDVSAFIVESLKQDREFDEILDLVFNEFDADKETIREDLSEFVATGKEIGFIVD